MARIKNGMGHARTAALHSKETVSINFENDIGAKLRQYAAYIQEEAVRPAAYAAAEVFYGEMKMRTAAMRFTGTLNAAIYHWYDSRKSGPNFAVYAIGPNKKKAPHWYMVEFGTSKMAARSYVRATYDTKLAEAMDAARARLAEKMKEIGRQM